MSVVVIGAGQAGLAVSHELGTHGVEHVVLEQSRIGESWRGRWDSFTLVTPNWTLDLPGNPYAGPDPNGHVPRDEIVDYLESYATGFEAPVRTGVRVTSLTRGDSSRFRLDTSDGVLDADTVVVCTGAFQQPFRPAGSTGFPADLLVLDASGYRRPDDLPSGRVLVVGSGQTGCQLAEELQLAGRDPVLACGRAPWAPRRLDDEDIVTWLGRTTFFEQTLDQLPVPGARLLANVQATGAGGGHDLHYRTLQALGVQLAGRLEGVDGHTARFRDDLADSVAFGDARWADMRRMFENQLPAQGIPVPELPIPDPFAYDPIETVDLRDFGSVILTSGFRPDYGWIDFPICDALGFPLTVDGASSVVPGLWFCGVHFMRTRRSAFMFGVGRDASVVAGAIAGQS